MQWKHAVGPGLTPPVYQGTVWIILNHVTVSVDDDVLEDKWP